MKYTALTIGPIVKSLMQAHRTKELWAASYFFSFLMKQITDFLQKDENIIVPYPYIEQIKKDLELDTDKIKSAGIYPDRLILQSENGLFDNLQKAVDMAVSQTAHKFSADADKLKNYLNTHIVEFEYQKRDEKENDNLVFQANDFLATCELQSNYEHQDSNAFIEMLQNIDKTDLYRSIFGKHTHFLPY